MQELILIGAIALIVFGPRKLPQLMRTAGKMMAEFRKATNDFKETWEREVDFEELKETDTVKNITPIENTIAKSNEVEPIQISAPEIKEIKQEDFEKMLSQKNNDAPERAAKAVNGKQDWL
jgi:Tat protein translocase TatB subunit